MRIVITNVCFVAVLHYVLQYVTGARPVMETSEIHINITAGNTAILPCMISNIQGQNRARYQVVWTSPSMSVISHGEIITMPDHRFTIDHPYLSDWNLHIEHVRSSDRGKYFCQVNTKPVQQKVVYLHVQVPPTIQASTSTEVREGRDLDIYCNVTGQPTPTVSWQHNGEDVHVTREHLNILNIQRHQGGKYTCTATNGIEPTAHQSIMVDVQYPPVVTIQTTRIGQYQGRDTIFDCQIESNPLDRAYWTKGRQRLPGKLQWKYDSQMFTLENGATSVNLLIRGLEKRDFGDYKCEASNTHGKDKASVTLYELISRPPVIETTTANQTPRTPDGVTTTTHRYVKYTTTTQDTDHEYNPENSVAESRTAQDHKDNGSIVVAPGNNNNNNNGVRITAFHSLIMSSIIVILLIC